MLLPDSDSHPSVLWCHPGALARSSDFVQGSMRRRFQQITGFVLAGGASRRMGCPKESLVLGRLTMLERQVRLLESVCASVAVVGLPASGLPTTVGRRQPLQSQYEADGRILGVPVYPDELPSRGPLGGIYTGLLRTRTKFNLFLGCDLPFMELSFLRYLCRCALENAADVTVAEIPQHGYQPLCAIYQRRALRAVRAKLAQDENKVSRFFPRVRCRVLSWPEISRAGFALHIFANMNTPADYEAARKRLR